MSDDDGLSAEALAALRLVAGADGDADPAALRAMFLRARGESESDSDEEDDIKEFPEDGGGVRYRLAPNDGEAPGALFAYNVWNGCVVLADHLRAHPDLVRGRRVLELGAGAAVPSLLAVQLGASCAVLSDYPAEVLVRTMAGNVRLNSSPSSSGPLDMGGDLGPGLGEAFTLPSGQAVAAVGYAWGTDASAVLRFPSGEPERFDVVFMAECLWKHDQHPSLIATLGEVVAPGGQVLVSFGHHVPGMEEADEAFFGLAEAAGFEVEAVESRMTPRVFNAAEQHETFLRRLVLPSP